MERFDLTLRVIREDLSRKAIVKLASEGCLRVTWMEWKRKMAFLLRRGLQGAESSQVGEMESRSEAGQLRGAGYEMTWV